MRYFQNSLATTVSISYYFKDESLSITLKPNQALQFPDDFDGPYSVGISDAEQGVVIKTGDQDGSSVDVPK